MYSPLKFTEAIKVCFNKYADFTGRASRSEYWWFTLFCYLIALIADFIDVLLYGTANELGFFGVSTSIICMIPSISVAIRRLHDVNRSGWSWLWAFTVIGVIPLLYWSVKAGDDGKNYYGINPLKKRKNNNVVGAEASISKFVDKEKVDAIDDNEDFSEVFEDTDISENEEASNNASMYLEFQNGSLKGQRIMIFKSTTIGRSSENDIALNNNKISGTHCKLSIEKNEFFIEDLNSTNGTFLNGNKISKSKIKCGDELKLCSIKIKVE